MKRIPFLVLIGILLICQSCSTGKKPEWLGYTTTKLWESNNPNVCVWIDANKTTEEELKQRGVKYTIYSSDKFNGYLVEKSEWDKMKGFYLKLFGTPVTLTIDATTIVAVVGVGVGVAYVASGGWVDHLNAHLGH